MKSESTEKITFQLTLRSFNTVALWCISLSLQHHFLIFTKYKCVHSIACHATNKDETAINIAL